MTANGVAARQSPKLACMKLLTATALFAVTAVAEILGCWLLLLWRERDGQHWLLMLSAISLAAFAWLLTLHPAASGRVYAAYGGMYMLVALAWLRWVDGIALNRWDVLGAGLILAGALIIIGAHWNSAT